MIALIMRSSISWSSSSRRANIIWTCDGVTLFCTGVTIINWMNREVDVFEHGQGLVKICRSFRDVLCMSTGQKRLVSSKICLTTRDVSSHLNKWQSIYPRELEWNVSHIFSWRLEERLSMKIDITDSTRRRRYWGREDSQVCVIFISENRNKIQKWKIVKYRHKLSRSHLLTKTCVS